MFENVTGTDSYGAQFEWDLTKKTEFIRYACDWTEYEYIFVEYVTNLYLLGKRG